MTHNDRGFLCGKYISNSIDISIGLGFVNNVCMVYSVYMISKDDIKKLAHLARIEIPQGEEEQLLRDIENILAYVGQVSAVEVPAEELEKTGTVYNVFRDDDESHESGEYTEALMNEAPRTENGYLKVKKIL
jgi:aspartyl-tRNA(Asn)/glutamyl-tRNA(Gln) amidotransferase subunit C